MKNILLIVEGAKTEVNIFSKIASIYKDGDTNFCFFSYQTNIYQLYENINQYGRDFVDTIDVLRKMCKTNEDKEVLKQNFAYIYLIFDYDCQDPNYQKNKLEDLVGWFDDETDRGKLYLNYPMVESFMDHSNYNLSKYNKLYIKASKLNGKYYKSLVKKRGYNKDMNLYTKDDFDQLSLINIYKAFYLLDMVDKINYQSYLNNIKGQDILKKVTFIYDHYQKIPILNTSIYFLVDYYGKKYFNELF